MDEEEEADEIINRLRYSSRRRILEWDIFTWDTSIWDSTPTIDQYPMGIMVEQVNNIILKDICQKK